MRSSLIIAGILSLVGIGVLAQNSNFYQFGRPFDQNTGPRFTMTPVATPVPVSFDNTGSLTFNGVDVNSASFTVSASANRLLLVGMAWKDDVNCGTCTADANPPTYATVPMTLLASQSNGGVLLVRIYYLLAPTSGANTLQASFTDIVDAVVGYASFTGVNQSTPLGSARCTFSASTTGLTLQVPSIAQEFIFDIFGVNSVAGGTATVGNLQTQRFNTQTGPVGSKLIGAGSTEVSLGGVQMSWSLDAAKQANLCVVEIKR